MPSPAHEYVFGEWMHDATPQFFSSFFIRLNSFLDKGLNLGAIRLASDIQGKNFLGNTKVL